MIVFPAPGSSASKKRMRGSFIKYSYTASSWCGSGSNSCYRKGEERVILIGKPQPLRFHTKAEKTRVAIERLDLAGDRQYFYLLRREHRIMCEARLFPSPDNFQRSAQWHNREHLDRLGHKRTAHGASRSYLRI